MDNKYNFYWGILHCHIHSDLCHYLDIFSDEMVEKARCQIDSLYKFVRDEMKYDFISYADHHNMGRMIELGKKGNSPWNLILGAWENYNEKGKFATILGYEYQDSTGEYNVYLNRSDMIPNGNTINELIASVKEDEKNIIFAAHNRPNPTDWKFDHHHNFRLVEIINDGGVPFEEWVVQGLEAGYKVGFIGGSDDHSCKPGRNSSTCVLASELIQESVWEALSAKRTFATTGIRPEIYFKLNDAPMGSEIKSNGKCILSVEHKFENCPEWVGIIKNGRLLKSYCPDNSVFSFSFEDIETERVLDYYYLKVIYPDGDYAYASPIWVSAKTTKNKIENTNIPRQSIATYELKKEFGERVGRNKWYNANSLIAEEEHKFSYSFRDMVCHLGPDPILSLPDDTIIYPTMDAVIQSTPEGVDSNEVYKFTPEDDSLILTSFCKIKSIVYGAGYLDGKTVIKSFSNQNLDIFKDIQPVKQFFYKSEFISPVWLASDGRFFCVLGEREGILFTSKGKAIGYFQDSYPAFPAAVKMRSIDEIYVLDFNGYVMRYSFAAATTGKLLWKKKLGRPALSLALTHNGILVYNSTTQKHNTEFTDVKQILSDGSDGGTAKIDLMNMRGVSITELSDGSFAALHNPNKRVSANY